MQRLSDGSILFHGSYCEVKEPDLSQCAAMKDFGRGFYLTTSEQQAKDFVRPSTRKAVAQGLISPNQNYGYVSRFEFCKKEGIAEYLFENADKDWLHCVIGHRKSNTFPEIVEAMKKYDIIGGKIANDQTNFTITTYLIGGYGDIGSKKADDICISQLIPERLKDQYCFRTMKAFDCIKFVGSERIWIR